MRTKAQPRVSLLHHPRRSPRVRIAESLVTVTYNLAWVFPIFILSKVLNVLYHQNIANHAYDYLWKNKTRPVEQQSKE